MRRLGPRLLLALVLGLAGLFGAQPPPPPQYPPELPPVQPSVQVLWLTGPAIAQDLPAAPPGQPLKILRLGPANIFASQAEFTSYCATLDANNTTVYTNAWATQTGTVPTLIQTTGCLYLPTYIAPNNMNTELSGMQQNTLPGLDIPALRTQYHADQVTMYDLDGSACGLGYIGAATYGKQWAFTVVKKDCAVGNFSDVHERGHNMGALHDNPNNGNTPLFPDVFGFCDTAHGRRDPMTYPSPCGGSRVAFFGNPQDTHFGYPFGDATHNVARVTRWAMPIMANFYPPITTCPTITLSPTSLAAGTVGTAYSRALAGSGGTGPYTFAVTSGSVPAGLTLSGAGLLSGTPTTAQTASFTIRATDANGCTGSLAYTLTMACPTITLSPTSLPAGVVGTAYSQALSSTGGTSPKTFAVISGAIPTGLTLSSAGLLSGTPTTAQTATFTVRATDAHGCTGSQAYSVTIAAAPPPTCPTITLFPASLPNGFTGRAYTQTFTASGGTAPYTIVKTVGTFPAGLTYTGATLAGTPTTAVVSALTMQATDAAACTGTKAYSLTILQLPTAPTNLQAVP